MKILIANFLSALKNLIGSLELKLEALGSEVVTIFEEAFPAAEQAAIQELFPLGTTIISDLKNQGGLTNKQIASEALAQIETALLAAGKDFVITFAMQAISIVMSQQVGNTSASTVSNGGTLPGGTQVGG
jgi:hypothetical protein